MGSQGDTGTLNSYAGSDFDDFLAEEGILEEVTARVYKHLLTLQVQDAMSESQVSEESELRRRRLHARHLPDRGRAPTMESHRNHHRS